MDSEQLKNIIRKATAVQAMDPEQLKIIILKAAVERDGRQTLPCSKAFELAAAHNLDLAQIGKCCNDNKIKIAACQLGCFQ